jgi:anhydro-N-acetylmuramic acid kinase
MNTLQQLLPQCRFCHLADLGMNGDAKEAILFAVLANESLVGGRTDFGSRQSVPSVSMGKICFPN